MNERIGFISASYPPAVFREMEEIGMTLKMTVIPKYIESGISVNEIHQFIKDQDLECVIARGRTADKIKNNIVVPLVFLDIFPSDIIKTLYDMNGSTKKIGVIAHQMSACKTDDFIRYLKEVTSFDLHVINYSSPHNFDKVLELARDQGINMIIGGSFVAKEARKFGLDSVEILPTQESMINILNQARQMVQILRKEEAELIWHKAFFGLNNESIAFVNAFGKVTDMNKNCLKIFNISFEQLASFPIVQHIPQLESIPASRQTLKEIITIRGQQYAVSIQPIIIRKKYRGAVVSLEKTWEIQKLELKIRQQSHQKGLIAKTSLDQILGESTIMTQIKQQAEKYAQTSFNILIEGESGTGKELFAQGIHLASKYSSGPFVAINCAAIPESIMESELFGYEEGAFTGAKKGGKIGFFELSHGGTIFFDEINSMSFNMQARLLRIIQEKEIIRVGGSAVIPINTRIIAASNLPLYALVQEKKFRPDLFFRLNELHLRLPSLKDHKEDIPMMVNHFLTTYIYAYNLNSLLAQKYKSSIVDVIASSDYSWPGNVRELENIVKRCLVFLENIQDGSVSIDDLLKHVLFQADPSLDVLPDETYIQVKLGTLEDMENALIQEAYQKMHYNKSTLARLLDISRTTLWRRLVESEGKDRVSQ
jgi:transcriptional regulator with PAS, ATPase and Fis domain